jgi:hypothetical protein
MFAVVFIKWHTENIPWRPEVEAEQAAAPPKVPASSASAAHFVLILKRDRTVVNAGRTALVWGTTSR